MCTSTSSPSGSFSKEAAATLIGTTVDVAAGTFGSVAGIIVLAALTGVLAAVTISVISLAVKAEEVKDIDGDAQVEGRQAEIQAEIYQTDMDHAAKVLSIHEDKPEVEEAVDVVTTAKLITKVVTAASTPVSDASTIIPAAKPKVPAATPTVVPIRVAAASTKKRKKVVIRDPKEESTTKIPAETKSTGKGKGIMVEEPKPMKKKQQVELDEEYAR
nr:hypothetical protein [Tanacetum cinerariifolium]